MEPLNQVIQTLTLVAAMNGDVIAPPVQVSTLTAYRETVVIAAAPEFSAKTGKPSPLKQKPAPKRRELLTKGMPICSSVIDGDAGATLYLTDPQAKPLLKKFVDTHHMDIYAAELTDCGAATNYSWVKRGVGDAYFTYANNGCECGDKLEIYMIAK
jgi:hypothetical protein